MSPSTLTALKVVATPWASARRAARSSMSASVSTKTSSVARSGAIMPAPLPMAATVTVRPPVRTRVPAVFVNASVVMMARAASGNRSGPSARWAARTPSRSRGADIGTPMRPVAQASTRPAGTPSSSAASAVDASTTCSPWRPVHAFAFPACTRTAEATPARSRARVVTTGAAGARLVVRTPAATPGASSAIRATSGPRVLKPARTPAKRKPGTRTRWARRASFTRAPSRLGAVALLVLLPAAAGAGIVASHLVGVAAHRLHLLRTRRRITVRQPDAGRRLALAALEVGHGGGHGRLEVATLDRNVEGRRGPRLCGGLHLELDAHQLLDHVRLHAADQLLEEVVPLLLVLLERVLLPVPAEPDALLQVVHAEEMIPPQGIEGLQPDDVLEVPHHGRREQGLALGVRLPHTLGHHLLDLRGPRAARGGLDETEPEDELGEHGVVQGLQLPLVRRHLVAAVARDQVRVQALGHITHIVAEILPRQQIAPAGVDDLALLVEHVVVLEEVLADVEVVRLDLLLGVPDGARDEPVLDRHALLHAEPLHQVLHAVGAEDAQQVVLERQVEARRARIP